MLFFIILDTEIMITGASIPKSCWSFSKEAFTDIPKIKSNIMAFITLLIGTVLIYFKMSPKGNVFNTKRDDDSGYDKMLYYRGWIAGILLIAISLAAIIHDNFEYIR